MHAVVGVLKRVFKTNKQKKEQKNATTAKQARGGSSPIMTVDRAKRVPDGTGNGMVTPAGCKSVCDRPMINNIEQKKKKQRKKKHMG